MTAPAANRAGCQHPRACQAVGPGRCRACNMALVGKKFGVQAFQTLKASGIKGTAKSKEARRAKKVHITLASLAIGGVCQ